MLPPRANLVAVRHADPSVLAGAERAMAAHPELTDVWRPAEGWIAATAPLPESDPDPPAARAAGLAFADGRDLVLGAAAPDRVAELARRSPERLAELPGDFTFVHFGPHEATAVRACGAGVPLHVGVAGERIAIATRLDLLAAVLDEDWRFEPLTVAAWTTGYAFFPHDRSLLSGLVRVPRGHAARLRPAAPPGLVRYWDPRGERPRPSPDHAPALRAALIATLERELDEDGRNLLTLSGGVDSSSLAGLACGPAGRRISTLTLITTAPEARRELSFVDRLDRRCGFGRRDVIAFDTAVRLRMLREAPPSVTPVLHPALCVLPEIASRTPTRVLFGGEVADHVCGAELGFPDWVAHTPPRALPRHLRSMPFGREGLRIYVRQRAAARARRPPLPFPRDAAAAIHPDVREQYREWWHARRRAAGADRRPHRWVDLMLEADGYVEMNWEVASRLGIRRVFPFASREVIEHAFRWHPWELIEGGPPPQTKKMLRAALREDVPPENLMRTDRGWYPLPGLDDPLALERDLPPTLEGIVRDDWLADPPAALTWADAQWLEGLRHIGRHLHQLRPRA